MAKIIKRFKTVSSGAKKTRTKRMLGKIRTPNLQTGIHPTMKVTYNGVEFPKAFVLLKSDKGGTLTVANIYQTRRGAESNKSKGDLLVPLCRVDERLNGVTERRMGHDGKFYNKILEKGWKYRREMDVSAIIKHPIISQYIG